MHAKNLILGALLVASTAAATSSQAIVFNLNTVYTGATPGGVAPWMTITINDVSTDVVNMIISHNATSAPGQFISDVYFNIAPSVSSVSLSAEVNANKRSSISVATDAVRTFPFAPPPLKTLDPQGAKKYFLGPFSVPGDRSNMNF